MPSCGSISNKRLMCILSVCSITPFFNDVYLASLPDIGLYFQTENVQLVMSVGLFGLALSQLFYGPLSDRFGRKPVLLSGLLLFTLASAAVVLSQSFEIFLLGRFFQAVGACSTLISALAIARDRYSGDELVNAVAMVMAMVAVCPCIAPIIGSGLHYMFGWRASFVLLFIMGLFYLLFIGRFFSETLAEKRTDALSPKQLFRSYVALLGNRHYLGYTLTSSFSYATLFSVLTVSPIILINRLGMSLSGFSLVMGSNGIILILLSRYLPVLNTRFSLASILHGGSLSILAGASLLAVSNLLFGLSYATVLPAFTTMYIGLGLTRPSGSAGAMSIFPANTAGSAAAMFTFFAFIGGAIFTVYAGIAVSHSIAALAALLVGISMAGLATSTLCQKPLPASTNPL